MTRRSDRNRRLQWQSRALVLVLVPVCAGAVAAFSIAFWEPDTRDGLLASFLFAAAAWGARAATPAAAVTGGILAAAMVQMNIAAGQPLSQSSLWPLLTLFLLTFMATRFGRRGKEQLGIAEAQRGRNAAQVVANLGIAALAGAIVAVLSLFRHPTPADAISSLSGNVRLFHWTPLAAITLVAALAEATADTVSSELGEVLGGKPFLITTRQRVLPGTDGAVSVAGTLTGTIGACVIVLVAMKTMGLRPRAAIAAGAGAFGGLFFDSLLGATLEKRGWLNNDAVNFLSTLAAALLALALLLCINGCASATAYS